MKDKCRNIGENNNRRAFSRAEPHRGGRVPMKMGFQNFWRGGKEGGGGALAGKGEGEGQGLESHLAWILTP